MHRHDWIEAKGKRFLTKDFSKLETFFSFPVTKTTGRTLTVDDCGSELCASVSDTCGVFQLEGQRIEQDSLAMICRYWRPMIWGRVSDPIYRLSG